MMKKWKGSVNLCAKQTFCRNLTLNNPKAQHSRANPLALVAVNTI
jgi:hypothetical protein